MYKRGARAWGCENKPRLVDNSLYTDRLTNKQKAKKKQGQDKHTMTIQNADDKIQRMLNYADNVFT